MPRSRRSKQLWITLFASIGLGAMTGLFVPQGCARGPRSEATTIEASGQDVEREQASQTSPEGRESHFAECEREELALGTLRDELARVQDELTSIAGSPQEWDPGIPDAYLHEAIERAIKEEIRQLGLTRMPDLECAEFPCVAVFRDLNGEQSDAVSAALKRRLGVTDTEHEAVVADRLMVARARDGTLCQVTPIAIYPKALESEPLLERLDFRFDRHNDANKDCMRRADSEAAERCEDAAPAAPAWCRRDR